MGIRNLIGSVGCFLSGQRSSETELVQQVKEYEFNKRAQAIRSRFALARIRHQGA